MTITPWEYGCHWAYYHGCGLTGWLYRHWRAVFFRLAISAYHVETVRGYRELAKAR